MNKAFEKILEFIDEQIKIEESIAKSKNEGHPITHQYGANCMNVVKKFVQEVAEEYKGGWIPCSERLPEIGQEVIVTTQNGSVCSNIYYDYTDSNAKEPCFHSWDDEMWNCFMPDVIAWQPLPEPYKERDSE